MHIHCPHCRSPVEVVEDQELRDVICPSCGSSFNLLPDETVTRVASERRTLGHFELIDRIGIGAFGEVWTAHDTELDRTVAIKLPRKGQLTAEEAESFLREARSAARLNHPGIVAVHEVGKADDQLFIVSDYVRGVTLADRLTSNRPSPKEAAELVAQLADAVQHAHEHGVIHRDLKPSNIMLDDAGQPRIMDFGLAKREAGEITMTMDGKVLGTPAYMSPEQAKGAAHDADARSDVYSLGVILFELLTGELPFRGNARMLVHQVIHDEPPSPRRLSSQVPLDLDTICLKCLEKNPDTRYHAAGALAKELRWYLAGKPIDARPVSRVARGWRWCKRNPVVASLWAAVMFVLITGSLVSLYFGADARHQANAAKYFAADAERQAAKAMDERDRAMAASAERRRQLYISDMNVACQALTENNLTRVAELLARNWPESGRADLRGFEWRFLRRACDEANACEVIALPYLTDGLAVSPDDRLLAVGLVNRSIAIVPVKNPSAPINPLGPADCMFNETCLTFLPHSDTLAYSLGEGIRFHKIGSGAEPEDWPYTGTVTIFAVSPDGKYLAQVANYSEIQLSTVNGVDLAFMKTLQWQGERISNLTWSGEQGVLASSAGSGDIRIWNVETGESLAELKEHREPAGYLSFSPDGELLASGSNDNTIKIWDWRNQRCIQTLTAHKDQVYGLQFSPLGRLLASGGRDNVAFLWESSPDREEPPFRQIRVLRGHSAAITGLAFSHQGDFLATTSSDSTIRLWDMRREPAPDIINVGTGQWVGKLAFAADGHTIAAICNQYEPSRTDARTTQVMFWDVVSGKQLTSLDTGRSLTSFAFCQNGRLATGGHNGEIDIWNWRERTHVKSLGKHTSCVFDLDFAPTSNLLASASADKTARIWNLTTGREFRVLSQHDAPVKAVAFSPDERTIATGCDDRKVRTWNIASQEPPKVFKDHAAAVLSVAFSPDGQSLVSTSWDNTLRVWDSHDVDRKPKVLTGHSLWVSSVLLTSDGRTLFSASGDRTVKSWDVATWQQTFTFNGHTKGVQCLAVSPDGNIVASGSRDGAIRLWRAATTQ